MLDKLELSWLYRWLLVVMIVVGTACGPTPNESNSLLPSLQDNPSKYLITLSDTLMPRKAMMQRQNRQLVRNNQEVILFGTNRYELAGGPNAQLCSHTSGLLTYEQFMLDYIRLAVQAKANVIRLWAFQSFAGPSGQDFTELDKVITAAKAAGLYVILVLENNWQDCTYPRDKPKSREWFAGGYRQKVGYPLSFEQYVKTIVRHYQQEPAIAMWQIINEGKLYEDPATLKKFLHEIAYLIRSIDPYHLISAGAAIQCWQGYVGARDFQAYHDSQWIDVLDAHDYEGEALAWPTCMEQAAQAARALNKPLIIGEAGINRDTVAPTLRSQYFRSKIQAALTNQVAGYLVWHIQIDPLYHDGYDILVGDPALQMLQDVGQGLLSPKSDEIATTVSTSSLPPSPSIFSCLADISVGNTWQEGNKLTAAAVNISISNTSSVTIKPPWRIEITAPNGVGLTATWNMKIVEQQGPTFRGLIEAAWAILQPNSASQVNIGGVLTSSKKQVVVEQVKVNDQNCNLLLK